MPCAAVRLLENAKHRDSFGCSFNVGIKLPRRPHAVHSLNYANILPEHASYADVFGEPQSPHRLLSAPFLTSELYERPPGPSPHQETPKDSADSTDVAQLHRRTHHLPRRQHIYHKLRSKRPPAVCRRARRQRASAGRGRRASRRRRRQRASAGRARRASRRPRGATYLCRQPARSDRISRLIAAIGDRAARRRPRSASGAPAGGRSSSSGHR